jgi:hypothetical protein
MIACDRPGDRVTSFDDCDDDNDAVHPGAPEVCNDIDDDCDDAIDEGLATTDWYLDDDGDGYGEISTPTTDCERPDDHVESTGDCDDSDPLSFPGAEDTCDGEDNDCDGEIDEDGGTIWYQDEDGDGYGSESTATLACEPPSGDWTDVAGDCDDWDGSVSPAATEECNGIDDDCDGTLDNAADCPCTLQMRAGHSYLFCAYRSDWDDARTSCMEWDNFRLVTIDDADEQTWVYDRAYEIHTWYWWWIGYNDRSVEDSFEWDDGSTSSFDFWAGGQPDDAYGEDCVHMYDWSGRWNDLDCDIDRYWSTNIYYICESTAD